MIFIFDDNNSNPIVPNHLDVPYDAESEIVHPFDFLFFINSQESLDIVSSYD